jgi:glucose-1-phosphate adenylyltransferase
VLAGDHVYKMDYAKMLAQHVARGSRVTVACTEVPIADAVNFGVVQLDERGHVRAFDEKPPRPTPLPDRPDAALASMGIYLFDAEFLYEELRADARDRSSGHDFGKDILPRLVKLGIPVHAHRFSESCVNMARGQPYWRDVGTVDAYWEANLDLTQVVPDLNMYDQDWPIWTCQEQLPPAKFVFDDDERRGYALDSLVSGGCIISGSKLKRSLLFSNVHVHSYCTIEDSVILPNVDIGRGVVLKRAIVDKDCRLPPGLVVGVDPDEDRKRFHVTAKGVTLVTPQMLGGASGRAPAA